MDGDGDAARLHRLRLRAHRLVAALSAAPAPQHVVVMGVSGCGKTTIGQGIAAALGWPFIEGDAYHLPASVAKMAAHVPLEDADRWPWLERLAALMREHEAAGRSSVLACSSLKRAYRDLLRSGAPRVRFLHLHGSREVLQARLDARKGHFFPPDLLASQFAALEPLGPDEDGVVVDVALPVEAQVAAGLRGLGLGTEAAWLS
jgi:carbohydrate kinase (thermoresistant glucokinase family)